jgi:uncharacterized DUF497 family protein
MKIEFDAAKDEANQAKHGVSLAAAAEIDLDGAVIFEDLRLSTASAASLPSRRSMAVSMPCTLSSGAT